MSDLSSFFGALLQYPASNGDVFDYRDLVERFHAANALVAVAADLLALMKALREDTQAFNERERDRW